MTYYTVTLAASAVRDLARLPQKIVSAIYEFITGPLRENPYWVGKALRDDYEGFYSARRGEYRVIYRIVEDKILIEVARVRHRKDVYRPA